MIWSQYQEVLEKLSFEKGKRDFWETWKPGISEFLVKRDQVTDKSKELHQRLNVKKKG